MVNEEYDTILWCQKSVETNFANVCMMYSSLYLRNAAIGEEHDAGTKLNRRNQGKRRRWIHS